jgi:hypothetical protein
MARPIEGVVQRALVSGSACAPGQSHLVVCSELIDTPSLDDESFATADVAEPEGFSTRTVDTHLHLPAAGASSPVRR